MACSNSTGGCQSNCYSNDEEPQDFVRTLGNKNTAITTTATAESLQQQQKSLCVKCKANSPIAVAGGGGGGGRGGDEGRFCGDCFRSNLYAKFRLAVTSHAMINPSDNVLVAFSGGPSSRVALQFVHEMQQRAQKNFDASKDRSLPVFGVGVTFIDESAACPIAPNKVKEAIQEIRVIVSNLAPPIKQLHVVPIEDVYASNLIDGKDRLEQLLNSVNDTTGKEDLLLHLRILTLQKVAMDNGYNRVILGSCTSRIACHVISATVKGQGYSLSADIQYVDARREIPVVLPLRDCTAQELNLLCRIDGLETVKSLKSPPFGINALVSSFVSLLQEENPSRECTIVRTAGKLTPFHFNRIPEINDSTVPLATRRRQRRYNLNPKESIPSESFCPICNSPLNKSELFSLSSIESCQGSTFGAACCSSCWFQIIPKDPSSMEQFHLLLPQKMVSRAKDGSSGNVNFLREQVEDCLLSDNDDEN